MTSMAKLVYLAINAGSQPSASIFFADTEPEPEPVSLGGTTRLRVKEVFTARERIWFDDGCREAAESLIVGVGTSRRDERGNCRADRQSAI